MSGTRRGGSVVVKGRKEASAWSTGRTMFAEYGTRLALDLPRVECRKSH